MSVPAFSFLMIFFAFLFDLEVRRAQRKGRFMQEEMRGHLERKFIEDPQLHQEKEKAFCKGSFKVVVKATSKALCDTS